MPKHIICVECQYNNYPTCKGTIMSNGEEMNIENLRKGFQCGQRDDIKITNFSIIIKTNDQIKLEDHEQRIKVLEAAKKE